MSRLRRKESDYRFTPLMRLVAFVLIGANVAILPIMIYVMAQWMMPSLPVYDVTHALLPAVLGLYAFCSVMLRILRWRQKKLQPEQPMAA